MANIKKNFNFRNGVQVDDDNLLVTSTGLVGIGTTVPTEALDVRGAVKIFGDANISSATIGIVTITEVAPTQIIGAGVSIKSGIVTAQGTGIVTFYGDARFLQGMPTSQWVDTNAGFAVSSIYNTGGTVGIATTNPQFALQVGENPNQIGGISGRGVGISSVGNVNASGIISATTFSGALSGNVTGNLTGLVNSSGISTFSGINATGRIVGAATSNVIPFLYGSLSDLPSASTYHGAFAHVHATGKGYFAHAGQWWELVSKESNGVIGNGSDELNIKELETDQINVTGVSTFVGITSFFGDVFFPEKKEGSTGFERINGVKYNSSGASLEFNGFADATFGADDTFGRHLRLFSTTSSGTLSKTAGSFTIIRALNTNLGIQCGVGSDITLGGQNAETIIRISPASGIATIRNVDISQQLTALNANVTGIVTAAELNAPSIGVGTITPANDIHVRKPGNTEIQITSDTGVAGLTVGREPSTANTNNAEFRYGGGVGANYSSAQSLDIINYGTGNFNYHLSAANAGNVDGDFHWHKGINNTRLMTLTGVGGSLGIGITTPSTPLHVLGDGLISGDLTIGGDLNPAGDFNGNVIGNISGTLTGNVNATSGVSTFLRLNVDSGNYSEFGQISATGVGIGITMADKMLRINSAADARFSVSTGGNVGIRTDAVPGSIALLVSGDATILETVGVGTNVPRSAIDFADAGQTLTGVAANRMFMVPPKVGAAQTAGLVSLVAGAMIYNTTLNKLQVYNGTNWETITSVEVTG